MRTCVIYCPANYKATAFVDRGSHTIVHTAYTEDSRHGTVRNWLKRIMVGEGYKKYTMGETYDGLLERYRANSDGVVAEGDEDE
jgi:hypothetical protein